MPGLPLHRRQLHLPLQLHRPVTLGLQIALHIQLQAIALQLQAVDLQPCGSPVRRQVKIAEQVATIEAHLTNLDVTQLDGHRQPQNR
ncbi:hypothetical protein D3C81_2000890 [compost metagenome]